MTRQKTFFVFSSKNVANILLSTDIDTVLLVIYYLMKQKEIGREIIP